MKFHPFQIHFNCLSHISLLLVIYQNASFNLSLVKSREIRQIYYSPEKFSEIDIPSEW